MKTNKLLLLSLLFIFHAFSAFAMDSETFTKIVEENMDLRAVGINFYNANKAKFDKDRLLSNKDLQDIYAFSTKYIENRAKMLEFISEVQDEVHSFDTFKIDTSRKTEVEDPWYYFGTDFRRIHYINPNEVEGKEKIRRVKMATVFGLILMDSYLSMVASFQSHDKIRYRLNRDYEHKNKLDEIVDNFFSRKQRVSLMKGIDIFNQTKKIATSTNNYFDQYLNSLFTSSPSIRYIERAGMIEVGRAKKYLTEVKDLLTFSKRGASYQTSKVFGNAMGVFQSRHGHMYDFNMDQKANISAKLRPLDVLMEKTPFRLTDKFIPGYYGHVAIWVGTEKELKELDVWDHPSVVKYHEAIRSGHHIIEALRPGVQINTLHHFLDIDDFAAIRPNELSLEQKRDYLIRAFEQVGKAYDFNFDVETDEMIVCSEIAYVIFNEKDYVDWETDSVMGRYTISPDHVAKQSIDGGPFTPVVMYQNAKEISEENLVDQMQDNLKGAEAL